MSRLTGLLPVAQGVAAFAALSRAADGLKAAGDQRSRGQIMADTLVERLTGQATADAVPVEVAAGDDRRPPCLTTAPARRARTTRACSGYGPIPAPIGPRPRAAAARAPRCWLRRLFTRPDTAPWSRWSPGARLFPDGLRRFLVLRDQTCRTPWCGAPIRHGDHVDPGRGRRSDQRRQRARACARPATTPNKPPAGAPDPARRRRAHRGDHHTHRAHLHQSPPTPTRRGRAHDQPRRPVEAA